ncbi:BirA family biotin operon repressor/biotin-[acetyl-CoA-carboxylase] ligase [Geothermobacter ehrlichii]|uniref:Bifunctional ligase/repressor BirA n=1 Tax=Geothermobacter ehrlichii TaxID=213224 RepID=A0A5D3WMY4_9BACT|nr:biotin--[acetyl-CoA-carboxylase] ligase [Geothermobacter ehrlichii]TYO99864.1 BirA family biotin operon repressor/biotin-[acetyl-CoA-carboxylase] ligase [Geothermobacter ehrlichii]
MPATDVRQQLLRLFREAGGQHVSGARLSRELGISRAAVWKQIELLRARGYRIEAERSRGYRLLGGPDRVTPEEIRSRLGESLVGRRVVCFERTDSTNLQALRLAEQGAEEGTVLIAEAQDAGKGRLGRSWLSPPGVNLYTSIILRPEIPPWDAPQMTFLAAMAVVRAVEEVCALSPRVKWPNDLLLGGRKVAGLLSELSADMDRVRAVVLGIGLNVNMSPEQIPSTLRYPATSLAIEGGRNYSRIDLACAICRHLDALYRLYRERGFEPVRLAWEANCDLIGRRVEVSCGEGTLRGRVRGIDGDGALLLDGPGGGVERILAGDVRPLGTDPGEQATKEH